MEIKNDNMITGLWMIEPYWMKQALNNLKAGIKPEFKAIQDGFITTDDGIAIIDIAGPIVKGFSFFGVSTMEIRNQMRQAASNSKVKAILMVIDSPGGMVAGTQQLADDIAAINKVKPVFAHIDDLGASAAFWLASQASLVTANPTAEIGSIGTVAVITDVSEMLENAGVKIHVVSTGEFKGAFTEGKEVTEAELQMLHERIDDINEFFLQAVETGRGIARDKLSKMADGRVHIAEKARIMGLIDSVMSFDDVLRQVTESVTGKDKKNGRIRALNTKLNIANRLYI